MDLGLRDHRALVTGGTRGIGRATVETFAAEGASVGFCARTADEVATTVDTLKQQGVSAVGQALDIADSDALHAWVEHCASELGGVDTVVANVSALAIPSTEDNWKRSFDVDMMGTVRLVEAAMPYLERSSAPAIIGISSCSGREIDFAAGPYGTFKAAVVHYIQGLAYQLTDKGIRANVVSPGNTYFEGGIWYNVQRENPQLYEHAMSLNPTGRMGTPEEIARSVVFLASPVSSRTSGANLLVDGALTRGVQL